MSDYEQVEGSMNKVAIGLEDSEKYAEERLSPEPLPSYFDNYLEFLLDEFYEKYILVHDDLYYIEWKEDLPDCFGTVTHYGGNVDFCVRYYNGTQGLSEAIEDAMKKE